ncbi:hypothetical protein EON83_05600 [bacterium]|nr:MAG: hypothetical protein EON83_05600 [bacterium]
MKHTIAFSLGVALLGATLGTAHAQRAPIERSDRRAQRQQAMQNMTPEQRAQFAQNQRQQRLNAATPEQRARMEAQRANRQNNGTGTGTQNGATGAGTTGTRNGGTRNGSQSNDTATMTDAQRETAMRALMTSVGITDKAQQDPIVTFVFAQVKAREPVLKIAREVATSLQDGKSTPDQIKVKWTSYQSALDTDKTRFEKELATLDAKIGWSKDARLQSFLSFVGVLNPDVALIGGSQAIFTDPKKVLPVSTTPPQNAANSPRKN